MPTWKIKALDAMKTLDEVECRSGANRVEQYARLITSIYSCIYEQDTVSVEAIGDETTYSNLGNDATTADDDDDEINYAERNVVVVQSTRQTSNEHQQLLPMTVLLAQLLDACARWRVIVGDLVTEIALSIPPLSIEESAYWPGESSWDRLSTDKEEMWHTLARASRETSRPIRSDGTCSLYQKIGLDRWQLLTTNHEQANVKTPSVGNIICTRYETIVFTPYNNIDVFGDATTQLLDLLDRYNKITTNFDDPILVALDNASQCWNLARVRTEKVTNIQELSMRILALMDHANGVDTNNVDRVGQLSNVTFDLPDETTSGVRIIHPDDGMAIETLLRDCVPMLDGPQYAGVDENAVKRLLRCVDIPSVTIDRLDVLYFKSLLYAFAYANCLCSLDRPLFLHIREYIGEEDELLSTRIDNVNSETLSTTQLQTRTLIRTELLRRIDSTLTLVDVIVHRVTDTKPNITSTNTTIPIKEAAYSRSHKVSMNRSVVISVETPPQIILDTDDNIDPEYWNPVINELSYLDDIITRHATRAVKLDV